MRFLLVTCIVACHSSEKAPPPPPPPPSSSPSSSPRAAAGDAGVTEPVDAVVVRAPVVTGGPLCGFSTFAELDEASWTSALEINRKLTADSSGEELSAPCGTCSLQGVDPRDARYVLRDGRKVVARVTLGGPILQTGAFVVDGIAVGRRGTDLLAARPGHNVECSDTNEGVACTLAPDGADPDGGPVYYVDGELAAPITGAAARKFLEGRTIRGIEVVTRL